jgi:hypothetical protein
MSRKFGPRLLSEVKPLLGGISSCGRYIVEGIGTLNCKCMRENADGEEAGE